MFLAHGWTLQWLLSLKVENPAFLHKQHLLNVLSGLRGATVYVWTFFGLELFWHFLHQQSGEPHKDLLAVQLELLTQSDQYNLILPPWDANILITEQIQTHSAEAE